jgi:hypothetical protein
VDVAGLEKDSKGAKVPEGDADSRKSRGFTRMKLSRRSWGRNISPGRTAGRENTSNVLLTSATLKLVSVFGQRQKQQRGARELEGGNERTREQASDGEGHE